MILGYLGPHTNSEIAAKEYAANLAGLEIVSYCRMEEVFEVIKTRGAERIIVPVVNSLTGEIKNYLKMISKYGLQKIDELTIPIRHCIAAQNGHAMVVCSHEEALKQCALYLDEKFPSFERKIVESTDEAARVAAGDEKCAAIANLETCLAYGLKIIEKDIVKNNFSTFWILERGD